jgi:adenosine deaminase
VSEYVRAAEVMGVSTSDLVDIARIGVHRSYAPDWLKQQILGEITQHVS